MGQGAYIAALLGHSGVVATALRVRVVSEEQKALYANAWKELQVLVAIEPQIGGRYSRTDLLEASLPELELKSKKQVAIMVGLPKVTPYRHFGRELA